MRQQRLIFYATSISLNRVGDCVAQQRAAAYLEVEKSVISLFLLRRHI